MRLAAPHRDLAPGLDEGTAVDGYVVDGLLDHHVGADLRYLVRAPHGEEATLITTRRPPSRRDRLRIRRLASLRRRLAHPAVLPAHASGEHDGHPYLITDAYPATTLGDLLADEAPLAPERLLALLAPVAAALDGASSAGLVHQTLGADSLLMGDGGGLELDSFGLFAGRAGPAWNGAQPGDVRYQPPEQSRGEPPCPESNVYSLAAIMVHALAGEPPFGGDLAVTPYAHAMKAPPRVTDRVAGLPPELDDVLAWGMAKEPAARPRSASELVRAAEAALGTSVVSKALGPGPAPRVPKLAPPVAPTTEAPAQPGERRRAAAVLAGAAAVAAACGAIAAVALDPLGDDDPPAAPARSPETGLWEDVADRRAELRGELAAARTSQAQAAAATELAAVYDGAAESARPSRLTGAARSAAAAYAALAGAAEAGDEDAFADASEAAVAAERRIASAPR